MSDDAVLAAFAAEVAALDVDDHELVAAVLERVHEPTGAAVLRAIQGWLGENGD